MNGKGFPVQGGKISSPRQEDIAHKIQNIEDKHELNDSPTLRKVTSNPDSPFLSGNTGTSVPVNMTTTTAADGSYIFDNLTPGDYVVTFSVTNTHIFTYQDEGADDANDSDADETSGATTQFTLVSGTPNTTLVACSSTRPPC